MANVACATLLQEGSLDKLSLGAQYAAAGMNIYTLRRDGEPLCIRLDGSDLSLTVEPDAWCGGDRHAITFRVPMWIAQVFAGIEDRCRQLLEVDVPTIHAQWLGNVRPIGTHFAILKAKINMCGPRAAKFYDDTNKPTKPPASWHGLRPDVIVHARCVCAQKQSIGLVLEVTNVRYRDNMCPF